ncbi:MAG: SDR family NAD(P)-dependent oxidoreductase [Alphaproteobacteria bacterium]|nr:SDR family NAD(P)-dependent oxidoreductase [Alphaproteobacteria bacterium]
MPETQIAAPRRFAGRVALVTGASRGLGAAIARGLGAEGAHVVLLARTVGGLEEQDDAIRAAGGTATLVPLDLRQSDKIGQAAAALFERFGRLDIVVGAAAVLGPVAPIAHADPRQVFEAITVNAAANFMLMRMVDPLLRRAEAGRAVFLTDSAADGRQAFFAAYAASKAALESLARSWAAELRETPVRVNLVDPGPLGTRLRAAAYPGIPEGQWPRVESAVPGVLELLLPSCDHHGALIRLGRGHS